MAVNEVHTVTIVAIVINMHLNISFLAFKFSR